MGSRVHIHVYMYMYNIVYTMYIDPTDSRTMTIYHAHYQGHQDNHACSCTNSHIKGYRQPCVTLEIHCTCTCTCTLAALCCHRIDNPYTYTYMYVHVHTHVHVCMVPIFFVYRVTDLPWSTGTTVISYLSMGESAGVGAAFHTSITE